MSRSHDKGVEAIHRAAPLFERVARETRLLECLQWPRTVEEEFFAKGGKELPRPVYTIDRDKARAHVVECDQLAMTLDVADPIQRWLTQVARSYADGNRLLLAVGDKRFSELSRDIYGGPSSPFDADTTNLDLASHLDERLDGEKPAGEPGHPRDLLEAEAFAHAIRKRAERIGLEIDVVIDDELSAKVLAGSTRVRVRAGATFRKLEIEGLFVHEVETHALTAQNGAAQPVLKFLKSGGPRSTRTQEGLAVFSEFYAHALPIDRMRRIVQRVRLIAAAESGADFLELYRLLREAGAGERDAYFDAQRICRGGLVEGGAPFTKDASYLAGFTEVFNFLQVAVRGGAQQAVEVLACGRIALDDVAVLLELRRRGVLEPPKYTPRWIEHWEGLLPFFAFASFLEEIDLDGVRSRHEKVLAATNGLD